MAAEPMFRAVRARDVISQLIHRLYPAPFARAFGERLDTLDEGLLPVPERDDFVGVAGCALFLQPVDLPLDLRSFPHVPEPLQGAYTLDRIGGGLGLAADLLEQPSFSLI